MRQFIAFTKKEILEQFRTGKLILFVILFTLFGIMNPAVAKLTPWMVEMMSEQFAGSGMAVTAVEVDALTSWTQFFKNMPMALVIFLILFSGILTTEYQKGTLINVVTKGMKRWKILFSKMVVMMGIWSIGYLISFGITFGYNAFFWDNDVVHNLSAAVGCLYLLGLWLISVLVLASVFSRSSGAVMLMVGAAFGVSYLLGLFPAVKEYMPSYLMDSAGLLSGMTDAGDYLAAVFVTTVLIVAGSILSVAAIRYKNE